MMLKIASQMELMWRLFGEMDESVGFRRALFRGGGGWFDVSIGQRTQLAKILSVAHHCIFEIFDVLFRLPSNPLQSSTPGAEQPYPRQPITKTRVLQDLHSTTVPGAVEASLNALISAA
jgi:hypothetical protein